MSEDPNLRHVSFEGAPAPPGRCRERPWPLQRSLPPPILRPAIPAVERPGQAGEPGVAFARWVLSQAGLDGSAYRAESLRRRVPACLRALKARSEDEARQRIAEGPELLCDAVTSLLIGVTAFFRDPDVFDALRTVVLPALADRPEPLRIWSAACASGAELYSFASLLGDAGLLDRAYLLGTDCRADVIEQAANARVRTTGAARDAGNRFLARWLEPAAGGGWRPSEALRRRVQWKVADLMKVTEPGPWDVIFWRNTAIYLNPDPVALVYHSLVAQLSPGGFLVVGKAERPPANVRAVPVSRCIYRKRGA